VALRIVSRAILCRAVPNPTRPIRKNQITPAALPQGRRAHAGGGALTVSEKFGCGLLAGSLAKSAIHPLDVVKKRFQVAGLRRSATYGACAWPHLRPSSLWHGGWGQNENSRRTDARILYPWSLPRREVSTRPAEHPTRAVPPATVRRRH
jgi:hypothetical protein